MLRSRGPEDASYSNTDDSPTVQNSPHGDRGPSELLKIKNNKSKGLKSERGKKNQAENLEHKFSGKELLEEQKND